MKFTATQEKSQLMLNENSQKAIAAEEDVA